MKAITVAFALAAAAWAATPKIKLERYARPSRGHGRCKSDERCSKPNFPNVVEGKVIVELTDAGALDGKREDGVDKVHATGNYGKGIKIGILDSGIDYTHPALGGGFGPGHKVIGGYDFVGDDYPFGEPVPDADPLSQCNGHGTHVAGTIGADPSANPYNITGVAHQASINAYRIFGCGDGTDDAIIVDALLRAYQDGNDVITLSLGGSDGWTEGWPSVVASRIAERGRVLTIAAGNSGEAGAWFTSYPANGISVISVASTQNVVSGPLQAATASIPHDPILYTSGGSLAPLPISGDWPVYATSRDATVEADACDPLPADTPDLSKYVTLVRRGTCNFTQKIANIAAKGGRNVLIYNNGGVFGPITTGSATAALIQESDGAWLLEQFLAGTKFTISFPSSGAFGYVPNTVTGGLVSDYSSYGPSFDMHFKPAVAAPGGGILSTWPVPLGAYSVSSGTSMATPHAAGVAALILKAKGKGAARGIRDLLETTSTSIPQSLAEGAPPHTLAQGGAGQVNVANAINYQTVVTPGELLLNDTAHWRGGHTIYIRNTGRKAKTYTLKHIPAGTAYSIVPGTVQQAVHPVPLDNSPGAQAVVTISSKKVTVRPGASVPVRVTISAPRGLDARKLPILSGQIVVSTAGETLRVSYLGAAAALKDVQVIDNTEDALGVPTPLLLDTWGAIQEEPTDYTFVDGDYPVFVWRHVFGSPVILLDLVSADAKIPTNLKRDAELTKRWFGGWFGFGWWWPRPGGSFNKVKTIGPIFEYEYMPRNEDFDRPYFQLAVPAQFANGTAIAKGRYRLLFRALRVTGNPARQEDYEVWLSPIVGVARSAA
ncbi:subtilisin-like protease [Auricularia subglabra TFB-10046 SS5]|nr:subtilisin-like protease [Auricularia subglabra TFB-10046 SS5]